MWYRACSNKGNQCECFLSCSQWTNEMNAVLVMKKQKEEATQAEKKR